jgi:hypothetical protein
MAAPFVVGAVFIRKYYSRLAEAVIFKYKNDSASERIKTTMPVIKFTNGFMGRLINSKHEHQPIF